MAANPVRELEALRDLISSSVDAVKDIVLQHGDPPLTLHTQQEHPIYRRNDPGTAYAIKTISSAAQMLRALCDPNTIINDLTYGCHDQTALLVACQANIPNLLGQTDRHVDDLSAETGLEADRLGRFLRSLSNTYIFEEVAPNRFANNALSVRFQPEGKRAIVGHCVDECRVASCNAWEALTRPDWKTSTAINKAPFQIAYDTDLDYFKFTSEVRTDIGARCKQAMAGKEFNLGQYLSLYPWPEESGHMVDVGGGIGAATMPIIRAFPDLRLTVQDIPDSRPAFAKSLEANFPDLAARGGVQFQELDFFQSPPIAGADVYFMRHVIHDWPDAEAVQILQGCARAMTPQSKLLICEHVVCPTYRSTSSSTEDSSKAGTQPLEAPWPLLANFGDSPTSRLDLQVYCCINAKQRTQGEYEGLARQAGLQLARVWRNMGNETILECRLGLEGEAS